MSDLINEIDTLINDVSDDNMIVTVISRPEWRGRSMDFIAIKHVYPYLVTEFHVDHAISAGENLRRAVKQAREQYSREVACLGATEPPFGTRCQDEWSHDRTIDISEKEQHKQNVRSGYFCRLDERNPARDLKAIFRRFNIGEGAVKEIWEAINELHSCYHFELDDVLPELEYDEDTDA